MQPPLLTADPIEALLRKQPGIWRGRGRHAWRQHPTLTSGFITLDAALPTGGWPCPGVIELCDWQPGHGELSLFLPTMQQRQRNGYWLALLAPPDLPYAPALTNSGLDLSRLLILQADNNIEQAWALEQLLRQPCCGMVMAWLSPSTQAFQQRLIRRLQLATQAGDSMLVLCNSDAHGNDAVSLKLRLRRHAQNLRLQLLKIRGSHQRPELLLPVS